MRGYIRRYVIFQAFASLVICVAAWFWISLVLDYASFQLLMFDWVQEMSAQLPGLPHRRHIFLVFFFVEMRAIFQPHPHPERAAPYAASASAAQCHSAAEAVPLPAISALGGGASAWR